MGLMVPISKSNKLAERVVLSEMQMVTLNMLPAQGIQAFYEVAQCVCALKREDGICIENCESLWIYHAASIKNCCVLDDAFGLALWSSLLRFMSVLTISVPFAISALNSASV